MFEYRQLKEIPWPEENTSLYQIDVNGIHVSRRKDNDMVNGSKLLKVAKIPQGLRNQILKNQIARVTLKSGHKDVRGVWVTFNRAKELASQHKINDILYPLLMEEPSLYISASDQCMLDNPSSSDLQLAMSNNTILYVDRNCHIQSK